MQENFKNIVLLGMPGAGKSYIGKKMAKLLAHFTYIDTDFEIEKEQGMSISEIFEKFSENHFRKLETEIIKKYSERNNLIISIGGGAFEKPENVDLLKKNGVTFYLKTGVKELFKRIQQETHRPLFKKELSLYKIKKMLENREVNYHKAHFTIDTDGKRAYTILNDIIHEYENYAKK